MSIAAVAVYVLDTFTAVKLLGYNSWPSAISSAVNVSITKWIFSGCIIFSWVLLCYEWYRAYRVMQKESIAEDYLDPLAVIVQSLKIPRGWRRFLVFAELTKSKKKAAWVCFFVYFQRKGAIRILAAEGPRQVLNAYSLYKFASVTLVTSGQEGTSVIGSFFVNIEHLAQTDKTLAGVFCSMAFTLIIWIFSFIFLILAILFWVFFVSCYLKKETLTGFCRRKVEKRLAILIKKKTEKIWEKEESKRDKNGKLQKSKGKVEEDPFGTFKKQPTLPVFDDPSESVSTLPLYSGNDDDFAPSMLSRTDTNYSVGASLLGNAGGMGQSAGPYTRPSTANSSRTYNSNYSRDPHPPLPPLSTNMSDPRFPPSVRGTPVSAASRRYSPPNANDGSSSWGGRNSPGSDESYEMQPSSALPSALMPSNGARRDMSTPGPDRGPHPGQPQRSYTDLSMGSHPRSMTPAGPSPSSYNQGVARSMTPGGPPPPSLTPGGSRSFTPTGGPAARSFMPGGPPPPSLTPGSQRSYTPAAQSGRSMTPVDNYGPRSGTPEIPRRSPERSASRGYGGPGPNGVPRSMTPGYGPQPPRGGSNPPTWGGP
jgi:hypothetical protein